MSREDLARLLAIQTDIPQSEAADQVDRTIYRILKKLRQGRPAAFPGIGKFTPGTPPKFEFKSKAPRKGGRRGRK